MLLLAVVTWKRWNIFGFGIVWSNRIITFAGIVSEASETTESYSYPINQRNRCACIIIHWIYMSHVSCFRQLLVKPMLRNGVWSLYVNMWFAYSDAHCLRHRNHSPLIPFRPVIGYKIDNNERFHWVNVVNQYQSDDQNLRWTFGVTTFLLSFKCMLTNSL